MLGIYQHYFFIIFGLFHRYFPVSLFRILTEIIGANKRQGIQKLAKKGRRFYNSIGYGYFLIALLAGTIIDGLR
jgi:hypothetical protein